MNEAMWTKMIERFNKELKTNITADKKTMDTLETIVTDIITDNGYDYCPNCERRFWTPPRG